MAFQEIVPDLGPQKSSGTRCRYSVKKLRGGAQVTVPEEMALRLLWSVADRFKMAIGHGESEGMIRLTVDPAGPLTARKTSLGKALLIRLGRWPGLAPRDVDGESVDTLEADGSITITVPTHARLSAPVPRQPVADTAAPRNPPNQGSGAMRPAPQRIDVTSRVLGRDGAAKITMGSGTRGGK